MGSSNGKPNPHYSLGALGSATTQLEEVLKRAAMAGAQDAVTSAFADIMARLRIDPNRFGEPLYHHRKSKMTIRCGIVAPLYIEYGVHDEQPVVVIRRVVALADAP